MESDQGDVKGFLSDDFFRRRFSGILKTIGASNERSALVPSFRSAWDTLSGLENGAYHPATFSRHEFVRTCLNQRPSHPREFAEETSSVQVGCFFRETGNSLPNFGSVFRVGCQAKIALEIFPGLDETFEPLVNRAAIADIYRRSRIEDNQAVEHR